eukprot:scaffold230535_cov29-Prasinocladus_malaysianus.AAC.1
MALTRAYAQLRAHLDWSGCYDHDNSQFTNMGLAWLFVARLRRTKAPLERSRPVPRQTSRAGLPT